MFALKVVKYGTTTSEKGAVSDQVRYNIVLEPDKQKRAINLHQRCKTNKDRKDKLNNQNYLIV
jgi:hypothetical protein